MQAPTPWRRLLYKHMAVHMKCDGKIVDLGGSRLSGYHELIKGSQDITVVNFDQTYGFDMNFDLEKSFPIQDKSFDTVLCINTLEHIFDHKHVLNESRRILTDNGVFIIATPFIMFVHPCPNDYWRYTAQTFKLLLEQAGFGKVSVTAIGKGPFLAALQIIYPVLKFSILRNMAYMIAWSLDSVINMMVKNKSDQYPLGYYITARP
jgi:SAM-dependent methyltransferase